MTNILVADLAALLWNLKLPNFEDIPSASSQKISLPIRGGLSGNLHRQLVGGARFFGIHKCSLVHSSNSTVLSYFYTFSIDY